MTFYAVLMTALLLSLFGLSTQTRTDISPMFEFEFLEGQANTSTTIITSTSQSHMITSLELDLTAAAWNRSRQGIILTGMLPISGSNIGVQTTSNMSELCNYAVTDVYVSFSIELWLSFVDYDHTATVLGMGSWDPSQASGSCSKTVGGSKQVQDWYFQQVGNTILFVLAVNQTTPNVQCVQLSATLNMSVSNHHVVVTNTMAFDNGQAQIDLYYNGAMSSSTTISTFSYAMWNASSRIQISSAGATNSNGVYSQTTWQGGLYLFVWHSGALSPQEVSGNFEAGVPLSAPIMDNLTQSCTVLQGSGMNILPFDLSVFDYDQQPLNWAVMSAKGAGTLMFYNGIQNVTTKIAGPATLPSPSTSSYFLYEPPSGQWGSAVYNLSVAVLDNLNTQFSVPASFTINVHHITVPPMPLNETLQVYASNWLLITLNSIDMDPAPPLNSTATSAFLLTLPVKGLLFLFIGSSTSPGAQIHTTSTQITPVNEKLTVMYQSDIPLSSTSGRGYFDSFTFGVVIKNTSSVSVGVISIDVTNPLQAQNVDLYIVSNAPYTFFLAGSNAGLSGLNYYLLQYPLQGNLTQMDGQTVVPMFGNGSPCSNNTVTILQSSNLVYTTAISIEAGRYNRSLDPQPFQFNYSVVDNNCNTGAAAVVNVSFLPIHHAPSLLAASNSYNTTTTVFNSASSDWLVVSTNIVDLDALPNSAYSTVATTWPPTYDVTASISPFTGALIRLNPNLNVAIQTTSSSTGSSTLSMNGQYVTCNVALASLQFQASVAGSYNVTITATQTDTGMSASQSVIITANNPAGFASTGSSPIASAPSASDSFSSIFSPTSKWLYITIAGGVVLLLICSWLFRYYRRQLSQKEIQNQNKADLTNVAMELAKAVSDGNKTKQVMEADIENKAQAKASEAMQAMQAMQAMMAQTMSSPRRGSHLPIFSHDGFMQSSSFSPTTPRGFSPMPPRTGFNFAQTAEDLDALVMSPRTRTSQMAHTQPTFLNILDTRMAQTHPILDILDSRQIEVAIEEHEAQLQEGQQQLAALRHYAMMTSPRNQGYTAHPASARNALTTPLPHHSNPPQPPLTSVRKSPTPNRFKFAILKGEEATVAPTIPTTERISSFNL